MNTLDFQTKTIREIALEAPSTVRIFENHKIDFCCGGRIPFIEACSNAGADPLNVLTDLEHALNRPDLADADPIEKKNAADLIDHIVCTHHLFTRNEVERLKPLADKVATRHGELHTELLEIREIVHRLGDDLMVHMQKEEMMLFPYIQRLERANTSNTVPMIPPFGTVNNPVRMMIFEHDQAGEMLKKIRALSSDYTTPADCCPSYTGLYAGLEDLEKDLHRHIHLENNILFPKAIELEQQLFEVSAATAA